MTNRTLLFTVTSMAALLGCAPLWPWLDLPIRIISPLALLLGLWSDCKERVLLPSRAATILIIGAFLWYSLHVSRTEIVGPASNLLALLLALRLLTEKSGRHLLQLFILSLLCLAASSLYSLSSAFLFFLVLDVLLIALGLFLLCYHEEVRQRSSLHHPPLQTLLTIGLSLPLIALAFVPLLFLILPRTQFPLWNFLNQTEIASSGISDHVEPGSVSALAQSRKVVLRVEVAEQPASELYWRVITLNTPEGRSWVRRSPPAEEIDLSGKGEKIEQEIYMEPTGERFIPALDSIESGKGGRIERSNDALLISRHAITQRSLVHATSHSGGRLRISRPFPLDLYLTLPQDLSPRLQRTTTELFKTKDGSRTKIAALEDFFRRQGLRYSLSTLPGGADPLDDFLFTKKAGYCEDFAVAFTTMLRMAGVPARLVGGFYGGEYSKIGGYYVVTEDRAHLWVEALVEGQWERIDPTLFALNAESVGNLHPSNIRGLSQWIDAFNYYWNRTVINYDLNQQISWMRRTGHATRQWNFSALFKRGFYFTVLLAGGGWLSWLLLQRIRRPTEERLLKRFLRQMKRDRIPTTDLSRGVQSLAELHPHPAAKLFARHYNAIIFSERRATPAEIQELESLLQQLRHK